jgi:hypothetical protein
MTTVKEGSSVAMAVLPMQRVPVKRKSADTANTMIFKRISIEIPAREEARGDGRTCSILFP